MVTRVYLTERHEADELADKLFGAGHEVAVIQEQDEERLSYVVATTAEPDAVREITGPQAVILTD